MFIRSLGWNDFMSIHRRTIVKGAAWSLPVIAAATVVPAAAASGNPSCILATDRGNYNAAITVNGETSPPYTNVNPSGIPHYDVIPTNAHVQAVNTYTNTGTAAWPVGTQIWVEVSNNQRDLHINVLNVSGAYAYALGTPTIIESPGTAAGGYGTRYIYTTVAEIPAGQTITVDWEHYATTLNAWNGWYTMGRVIIGPELSCDGTTTVLSHLVTAGGDNTPDWYYVAR